MAELTRLQKYICFVGGADLKILEKCPHDKNKFIATGIGVLISALMSICTMMYAIHSVAKDLNIGLLILISLFWGFVILGIDWGLVSTIHKKEHFDLRSFGGLIFRFVVAIILSFTVSKPLEVLVFKDYLPVARREMQVNYKERLNSSAEDAKNIASSNLSDVVYKLVNISDERKQAFDNDPIIKQLIAQRDDFQRRHNALDSRYKELNATSNNRISSAQNEIKIIDNHLAQVRHHSHESQIRIWENSKRTHNANITHEKDNIKKRNDELSALNTLITGERNKIANRRNEISADFKRKEELLDERKSNLQKEFDSITVYVDNEIRKTNTVSQVFDKDNLINNIIAISHL